MPILSNGSELTVWEDTENLSPDAILFSMPFDADGVGGAAAVKFAAVNPGTSLTVNDFIVSRGL